MAEIIEYTFDERPIYGFEILPDSPAEPGRTYRGGGYFTENDGGAWAWVSMWINGQKVVDARLLVGDLITLPDRIEAAVEAEAPLVTGIVFPEPELTLILEPSHQRAARHLGITPEELAALEEDDEEGPLLDFAAEDEDEPAPEEDDSPAPEVDDEEDVEDAPTYDITLMVDGGLIAGFGAARGGPAIVMTDVDGDVLLQFADELRDDLIAAALIAPSEDEADEWVEVDLNEEPEGDTEEPEDASLPEVRWAGHYLAREAYRQVFGDFCSYLPSRGAVLDIGCGTGGGASEALWALGYEVTGIDTWTPALEIADENSENEIDWADVRELEYDAQFDGAVAFHAFLHLDRGDLPDAFASVRRALKNNGVFLLVLDPAHELLSAPSAPDALGAMEFIADFTHGEVTTAAREASFEVLHDLIIEPLEDANAWEDRGKGRALILQAL